MCSAELRSESRSDHHQVNSHWNCSWQPNWGKEPTTHLIRNTMRQTFYYQAFVINSKRRMSKCVRSQQHDDNLSATTLWFNERQMNVNKIKEKFRNGTKFWVECSMVVAVVRVISDLPTDYQPGWMLRVKYHLMYISKSERSHSRLYELMFTLGSVNAKAMPVIDTDVPRDVQTKQGKKKIWKTGMRKRLFLESYGKR